MMPLLILGAIILAAHAKRQAQEADDAAHLAALDAFGLSPSPVPGVGGKQGLVDPGGSSLSQYAYRPSWQPYARANAGLGLPRVGWDVVAPGGPVGPSAPGSPFRAAPIGYLAGDVNEPIPLDPWIGDLALSDPVLAAQYGDGSYLDIATED